MKLEEIDKSTFNRNNYRTHSLFCREALYLARKGRFIVLQKKQSVKIRLLNVQRIFTTI